jgi:hypothetical protein
MASIHKEKPLRLQLPNGSRILINASMKLKAKEIVVIEKLKELLFWIKKEIPQEKSSIFLPNDGKNTMMP